MKRYASAGVACPSNLESNLGTVAGWRLAQKGMVNIVSDARIVQANERIIVLLMRLVPQWTKIDTAEAERLDNAGLYLLCGAGLVELCLRGRAWTSQNALDIEVTASGVWIDQDRQSMLPEEVRRAVPAWQGRSVAIEMQPVVEARLTSFGQEQRQELLDAPNAAGLFVAFLCSHPVRGRVAVRLLGNEGPAPGAVQQDVVGGALVENLKNLTTAIQELKGVLQAVAPAAQGPQAATPAIEGPANTILFQGNGVYLVGKDVVRVTELEDNVLQAFLEQPAMTKDELTGKSGADKAVDILRKLRNKYGGIFAAAITMPGGRGRGGYRVQVVRAADLNQTG